MPLRVRAESDMLGNMKTRMIGDITVSAIGLGGMPMSIEGRPEEARSIATIHAALDAGITLFDTADAYRIPR
jgi:aryl-alcohol dehydrogenase-like predicted oxidoreductase